MENTMINHQICLYFQSHPCVFRQTKLRTVMLKWAEAWIGRCGYGSIPIKIQFLVGYSHP